MKSWLTWWHQRIKQFQGHSRWLTSNFLSGFLVVLVSWGMYFTFLWPQMLFFDEKGLQAGWVGVWGDWAAHITYANVFALRPIGMWLATHPIHINSPFTYPFVVDALSGFLLRSGMNLVDALIVPSILITLFFLFMVYAFYYQVLKRASAAVIAVSLFLLNGGWGVYWLVKDWLSQPSFDTLLYPRLEATHLTQYSIEWISIITSEMIPQRAFLLGFPLALLIVWRLYLWWQREFRDISWVEILGLGIGSGALFLVHTHSFIALFMIAGVLSLSKWQHWRRWLVYALATGVVALPIAWLLHHDHVGSFFHWLPGWFANPGQYDLNWFSFWWVNYGLFLPLAAWGTWRYRLYRHPLVVSGWVIFAAINLFQFQPHAWDNTKLLTWAHLFLVIPVWYVLRSVWRQRWWGPVGAILLFSLLTVSGAVDTWRLTQVEHHTYQMWSREDFQLAAQLNALSQPGDRVLTGQNHNQWAVALTHTQTLMGYPGWIWTYGISDPQLSHDVQVMFLGGPEAARLLQQYQVRFITIGTPERSDLKANQAWFAHEFSPVINGSDYTVYETPPSYWEK